MDAAKLLSTMLADSHVKIDFLKYQSKMKEKQQIHQSELVRAIIKNDYEEVNIKSKTSKGTKESSEKVKYNSPDNAEKDQPENAKKD